VTRVPGAQHVGSAGGSLHKALEHSFQLLKREGLGEYSTHSSTIGSVMGELVQLRHDHNDRELLRGYTEYAAGW
jgi:hypothetical protein